MNLEHILLTSKFAIIHIYLILSLILFFPDFDASLLSDPLLFDVFKQRKQRVSCITCMIQYLLLILDYDGCSTSNYVTYSIRLPSLIVLFEYQSFQIEREVKEVMVTAFSKKNGYALQRWRNHCHQIIMENGEMGDM